MNKWRRIILPIMVFGVTVLSGGGLASAVVVLNDPLQGSTIGTRAGGSFEGGGWKITNNRDCIYWHLPSSLSAGAVEFYVKGLIPRDPPQVNHSDNNLFEMYDYTYDNADTNYNGFRNNPYKMRLNKNGPDYDYRGTTDACQITWLEPPDVLNEEVEWETSVLSWNPANNYKFRIEWGPPSGSNSPCRILRDDVLIWQMTLAGAWTPSGHSVRLAWSTRPDDYSPLNAIFSNFKVEDLANAIPGAPTITMPTNAETVNTTVAYVQWTGDSHSLYQMRINSTNNPDGAIVYDSQQISSDQFFAWSGTLSNAASYYAFVRLGTPAGWGPWSAGRQFTVNTSYVPPGADIVQLKGNTTVKKSGPFLGLGATYMQALRRCKYDRTRYNSDLAFLASKEIKYIRVLSMVGYYSAWQGKEIAPVNFTSQNNTFVPAWPDYWQQFRDMIDIAFDTYGIRTELTIFADAQLMPNKPDRINHMQTVLNNLVGREHKIMHLEVCNEAWQNGFPDAQGVADLREFCQYLTDRTILLVAISDSQGEDGPTVTLYNGSTADICTEHFSRDIGTVEGGWLPVRDPWRLEALSGVPVGSNNEPIGPGSSVAQETDPIKLVMAAAVSWGVNMAMYVFHSEAGVFGNNTFQSASGIGDYIHLDNIIPPEVASWVRNDGKESSAPFNSYVNGQINKWWPEVGGATNGCDRNYGKVKGGEFITFPIGILSGGLELEARRPMNLQVYNPLTGAVAYSLTKNAGDNFTLVQGPGAYIIKGIFTDVIGPTAEVSIDLGSPDVQQGMTHPLGGDGDTVPFTIGGRTGRKNDNPAEDFYYYFGVSDAFAYQGSKPDVYVLADYYDTGTNTLTLHYDATANPFQVASSVALTNTNTWKTKVWHVTDAYFGNRQNNGADFRIFGGVGNTFYLDNILVTTLQPGAPVIAEVSPDPRGLFPGSAYTEQLILSSGSPAPTWAVVIGPAGLQVSATGLVSGWTTGALGDYTLEIQATNAQGFDTEVWTVRVLSEFDFDFDGDVDSSDFGHLQECYSGNGVAYGPGCGNADSEVDGDVDIFDFNSFLPCMLGPGNIPGC